jgi:hypothetical protein
MTGKNVLKERANSSKRVHIERMHNIKHTNVISLASFVSVTFKGSFRILYVFASPIILSI